ncbi:MAG: Ig-like domain-containing protein [Clostridia bacterium]|nr:Ig-like domain-containing protein [Clostridia bacterium]
MKKKAFLSVILAAAVAFGAMALSGCKPIGPSTPDDTPPAGSTDVAVTSVSVTPSETSISVDGTATLTANVQPTNATNKTVSWATSNSSYVTVDQSGNIKGIAAGTATITATAGGKSGTCKVTVTASSTTTPPEPPVVSSEISYSYAGNETAAFEWTDSNPASATVQYKLSTASSYTGVDKQLIRAKSSTVARVDIVGLKGGATYDFKILTSNGKDLTATNVKIAAHDRSGYAFHTKSGGQTDVGAYKADGTLKDNAQIIYLTEANKNNIDGKNTSIAQYLGSFQSKKNTKPIVIRVIGTVGSATWNSKTYPGYSKTKPLSAEDFSNLTPGNGGSKLVWNKSGQEYTQDALIAGGYNTLNTHPTKYNGAECLPINGLNSKIKCSTDKELGFVYDSCWNDCVVYNMENVTIEGIGEDAEIFQWGFTFKTSSSVEVRNLHFDDYTEDACSFEGDSTTNKASSLSDFTYKNIWLHHNTFDEGKNYWDVCDEQDKGDGDGSTDFKGVKNVTIAYNTYINTHKTNLIGGGDDHTTANVTFHHNYYNACNQRMPLGREANMHMYNNYYAGSTLYSISLRAGAYAFIENCVFTEDRSDHYPIELKAGTNKDKVSLNASAKIVNCTIDKTKANNNNKCGDNYLYIGNDRSKVLTSCDNTFAKHFDTNANLFYYKDGKSDVMILHNLSEIQTIVPKVAGVQKHGGTVLDPDNFTGGGSTTTDPTPSGNPIGTMTVTFSDLPKSFRDAITATDPNDSTKKATVEVTTPMQFGSSPISVVKGTGNNNWTSNSDTYLQSSNTGTIEIDLTAYTGNAQIVIVARSTSAKNLGRYYSISGNGVTLYSAGYNDETKGITATDQTDTFVLQCGYKYTLQCSAGLRFKSFALSPTNSSPTATMPAPSKS